MRRRLFIALALLAPFAFPSCASDAAAAIPPGATAGEAMDALGILVLSEDGEDPRIAVIKDRHSARPGFHRVRPQLRRIQKEHRLLVEHLVRNGYGLLGCEMPLGPVEDAEGAETEARIIRARLDSVTELDEYGVYQPLRFQLLFRDRLRVEGVEDPALYEADRELWKRHVAGLALARRKDRPESERRAGLDDARAALRALDANVDARGAAAARNLLALAREAKAARAILLVGGAHVPAAIEVLRAEGVAFDLFQSEVYDAPAEGEDPEEDW